jgi:hypothetical protein
MRGAKKRKENRPVCQSFLIRWVYNSVLYILQQQRLYSPIDLRRGFTAVGRRRIDMRRHQTLSLSLRVCIHAS